MVARDDEQITRSQSIQHVWKAAVEILDRRGGRSGLRTHHLKAGEDQSPRNFFKHAADLI